MEPVYGAVNLLGRGVLAALGVRVRVAGLANIPTRGPVILASTHGSFLDFVVLEKAAIGRHRHVRFLTRHDAWAGPVVSFAMNRMQHIPVDRDSPAAAALTARRMLAAGEAVGIFPEAGISHSYTVRGLMRGAAALARETGAPVVPVAIWGAQRIASVGDPRRKPDLTRGRPVDARFSRPLHVAPATDLTEATQALGATLTALLEGLQRMPHHQPRAGEPAPWHPAHLGGDAPDVDRARTLDGLPAGAVPATWGPWARVEPALGGADLNT
ncbi:MAG: lysophospholipid acyltransferase family protein [Nostocoides sp.]